MNNQYKIEEVKYKEVKELPKILTAFSTQGWEFVETLEHDYYGPLNYYSDSILFKKEVR